jgi:hypothetical protein
MEKPLHVQVAEALGWTQTHAPLKPRGHACGDILLPDPERMRWRGRAPGEMLVGPEGCKLIPRYDTDWSATGPLIQHLKLSVGWNAYYGRPDVGDVPMWVANAPGLGWRGRCGGGDAPLEAVCRLLLYLARSGPWKKSALDTAARVGVPFAYIRP